MKYVVSEKIKSDNNFTAFSKARLDIETILTDDGYAPILVEYTKADLKSFKERTLRQFRAYKTWKDALNKLQAGDSVVIQYPESNNCQMLFLLFNKLKRRGVNVICLIHDMDLLRWGNPGYSKFKWMLYKKLELSKINSFSKYVVHNEKMIEVLNEKYGIKKELMGSLDIFDYILDRSILPECNSFERSVIIAGNLDKRKVKYLAELPDDVKFEVFGPGYVDENKENIHYNGKFAPEELPKYLKGGFGLVWDGETARTCSGDYGNYLKINNPHKTSLYLASGIPVIIWEEAALSKLVKDNKCGITVNSLFEIKDKLDNMTEEEYFELRRNAKAFGEQLCVGGKIKAILGKLVG